MTDTVLPTNKMRMIPASSHDIISDMGRPSGTRLPAASLAPSRKPDGSAPLPDPRPKRGRRKQKEPKESDVVVGTPVASKGVRFSFSACIPLADRPMARLFLTQVGKVPDGRSYSLLVDPESGAQFIKVHVWSRSHDGRMQYTTDWFSLPSGDSTTGSNQ